MTAGQYVVSMEPSLRDGYEAERIPAVLTVPGVAGVSTWEATSRYARRPEGGMGKVPAYPAYIAIFDLDDVDVARSEAFLDAIGRSFSDGVHMAVTLGEIMRQENPGSDSAPPAQGMMVVSLTPLRDYVDVMHEWYDTVHLGELLGCPGFLRARRYKALDGIPNFFAFYDLDQPSALDGDLFRSLSGRTFDELPAIQQKVGPNMTSNLCDVYTRLRRP